MQLKKNWDDGVKLEREQALELCAGYLADIRRRITDRANFLQSQLDKVPFIQFLFCHFVCLTL